MCERERIQSPGRAEKGSSLIEVLIALFVLMILSLGVLQMFSVAHYMNLGAAARTQMTFKCEQVMENVRIGMGLLTRGEAAPADSGIEKTAATYDLPYNAGDAHYAYWGPAGANVVEGPGEPYRLSYRVDDDGNFWLLTVTAVPSTEAGARRYTGMGIRGKRVTYVARIPK